MLHAESLRMKYENLIWMSESASSIDVLNV